KNRRRRKLRRRGGSGPEQYQNQHHRFRGHPHHSPSLAIARISGPRPLKQKGVSQKSKVKGQRSKVALRHTVYFDGRARSYVVVSKHMPSPIFPNGWGRTVCIG